MAVQKTTDQLIEKLTFFNLVEPLKVILRRIVPTKATFVSAIKPTTPLTAIAGVYADLAAARTSVNTLRTDAETRLSAIETKVDAITAALKAAGLMATT